MAAEAPADPAVRCGGMERREEHREPKEADVGDDVLGAADHKREGAVERESHAGDVASGLEEHAH